MKTPMDCDGHMQSVPMEVGSSSSAPGDASGSVVQVCFPSAQASVLDGLNRQRADGRLCDLSIHVQGHVFKAHRCVLAASSPYFHDQVLLKNMSTVSIPAVMDPLAFESVLSCAYTGQLQMLRDDIVNYLTVGSVLQMWHIVDKCTELLKEGRAGGGSGGGSMVQDGAKAGGVAGSGNLGCSSSNGDSGANSGPVGGGGGGQPQVAASSEPQHGSQAPTRPPVSESQSPSSTNYFSPRDGSSFGGSSAVATGVAADGGGASNTPSYCTPSGGEEAFLNEEEEEDIEEEEEEEVLYHHRKRRRGGGSGRRKKTSSVSEQEVGVSDSFGVSSYQGGDELASPKRPTYSQPSIMPRKQWVVVKTERMEDDDLIVVSGEEGGDEEEDEDERELELARARERSDFNISNVRSLSVELGGRVESDMDSQVDYCQSSEDYLKFEGGLLDQTLAQHLHDSAAGQSQTANRTVSALLGQVQSAATARAQLFPLDMQGNQVLLYSQASGLSLEAASPALGMGGSMIGGGSFKGPSLEHGPVHLSAQGSLGSDGVDGGGIGGGSSNGSGGSGKVFMCHCGKTFTHKSMRDRHINMHLDLRPFHCPVCSKKFKMKHHLTEHMKTHTGLKPYDCLGCGKKFMWRDSFMRHRSHCERRGGLGESVEGRSSGEGGRRGGGSGGEDGPDLISPPHLLMAAGEGGQSSVGGGGGRGAPVAPAHLSVLSPQHNTTGSGSSHSSGASLSGNMAATGVISQSPGQGSGMFGGLGLARGVCDEDVCEVSVNDRSVT